MSCYQIYQRADAAPCEEKVDPHILDNMIALGSQPELKGTVFYIVQKADDDDDKKILLITKEVWRFMHR